MNRIVTYCDFFGQDRNVALDQLHGDPTVVSILSGASSSRQPSDNPPMAWSDVDREAAHRSTNSVLVLPRAKAVSVGYSRAVPTFAIVVAGPDLRGLRVRTVVWVAVIVISGVFVVLLRE
jgi:hypothetical protein